jgi:hypothetical protein
MIEDMDELGDAGGEVPRTGMQGRPHVPSAEGPKVLGGALNKLMGETLGE